MTLVEMGSLEQGSSAPARGFQANATHGPEYPCAASKSQTLYRLQNRIS